MMKLYRLPFAALALVAAFGMAQAAGGGGGSGSSNRPAVKKTCKKGEVVVMVKKGGKSVATCAKAKAGILPDDELYDQGRELAKGGEYDWALDVLAAVGNQNDPHVLNYTGYANRKAGRLDLGISYYRKALAIDPNFVLAREYLGEGYVAAGKIELAKAELTEIGNRCGVTCEEYIDLSKAIASATP